MNIWDIGADWSKKTWIILLSLSVIGALALSAGFGRVSEHFGVDVPYLLSIVVVIGFFYPSYYCLVRIYAFDDDDDE